MGGSGTSCLIKYLWAWSSSLIWSRNRLAEAGTLTPFSGLGKPGHGLWASLPPGQGTDNLRQAWSGVGDGWENKSEQGMELLREQAGSGTGDRWQGVGGGWAGRHFGAAACLVERDLLGKNKTWTWLRSGAEHLSSLEHQTGWAGRQTWLV